MSLRKELRQHCRTARAALDAKARNHASLAIAVHLAASQHYRNARHVAIYWPVDDEVDLRELLRLPSAAAHSFYLPRMLPARVLEFRPLGDPTMLRLNDWGIAEPRPEMGATITTRELDLVCVPLLGFDRHGNRLGQRWNISLFHYRNHGAAYARVLVGFQVPERDRAALAAFFAEMTRRHSIYSYWDETTNPAYRAFLR